MITNIRLQNFKCHINELFEMSELTLFAGNNGVGKSSIIQSLLLLKQSYASSKLMNQNKVDLFNHSFVDLESAENLCYIKAYPKKVTIEIETNTSGLQKWEIDATQSKESVLDVEHSGSRQYEEDALFSETFNYLTAERIGPRRTYSKKTARVFNTKLGIQGELTPSYILNISNENIAIARLKHPDSITLQLYENLNHWLSDILGRTITARVDEENEQEVSLSFSFKGSRGGKFSALQVGFGYSFCLPIIVAVLTAKQGDLLIIENPEAHLHPSAQTKISKLIALAAEYGPQIIIETHSDHVLNAIRIMAKGDNHYGKIDAGKITAHYFYNEKRENEEEKEGRVTLKVYSDGRMDGWPNGFFDEWEKSLTDLIS